MWQQHRQWCQGMMVTVVVLTTPSCHPHSSCEDSTILSWNPTVWIYGATCYSTAKAIRNTLPWRERRITPWWNKKTCLVVSCKSLCNSTILPESTCQPFCDPRLGNISSTANTSTNIINMILPHVTAIDERCGGTHAVHMVPVPDATQYLPRLLFAVPGTVTV
jgi:hypothetical protein